MDKLIDAAARAQERAHNGDTRFTSDPDGAAQRACRKVELAAHRRGYETEWPGLYPIFRKIGDTEWDVHSI